MKLKTELPLVRFRADLPKWLAPAGEAFVEIDARPMGRCNLSFMAARDLWAQAKAIADGPAVEGVTPSLTEQQSRDWMALVYESCVISWRTNLIDDDTGAALDPTLAGFMELANAQVLEISQALLRFQTEAMQAGASVLEADQATIKN